MTWPFSWGYRFQVCDFPPGTSKWNKIEHRMFCHITQNWRGRPLVSHEVIIDLIANTTTGTGLKIHAELDNGHYPTGIKVSDEELAAVNMKRADFPRVGTMPSCQHERKHNQLNLTRILRSRIRSRAQPLQLAKREVLREPPGHGLAVEGLLGPAGGKFGGAATSIVPPISFSWRAMSTRSLVMTRSGSMKSAPCSMASQ